MVAGRVGMRRRELIKGGLAATVVGGLIGREAGTAEATAGRPHPVERPTVFRTRDWGARPPAEPIVVEDHPPTYIVVHHTAEPGNTEDFSREHAFAISQSIQRFHMDTRGWIDTGQQFTISRGGFITEGRHRSLEALDGGRRHVQGANVRDHNSQVIGIENEGLYTTENVPDDQWSSLIDLVTYMASQYDIRPGLIKGHRDFNATQCPGDVLYARLPELRIEVAARLGTRVSEQPEWPLLRPGDRGDNVRMAQRMLRDNGARGVPVDGIFGPATEQAVRMLRSRHGIPVAGCCAAADIDEGGYLGADLWPALVTPERSVRDWKVMLSR